MNSETVSIAELKSHLIEKGPIIDVRAPVEFQAGAIPGSVNLPLLDDSERELVGTCYKRSGQEKAMELGFKIVAGENKKSKIEAWKSYIAENPQSFLTCYRGGKRSQITQQFLKEQGLQIRRLEAGYKEARQFFISELSTYTLTKKMILLTGFTGSAKTHLLKKAQKFYPAVDLEDLAKHRGSAFGQMRQPQPAQADFENFLSIEILRLAATGDERPFLFEDESRMIGHRHLTVDFFNCLRDSQVILVNQTLEERIENIYGDYILNIDLDDGIFQQYENSVMKIEKRLGGAIAQEILSDVKRSRLAYLKNGATESNKIWIEKLLIHYYDILYKFSFDKRSPKILFQGKHAEILDFLKSDIKFWRE